MDIIDIVIIVAAIAYAVGGFRSGAVVGVGSLVGFFGGAIIGGQVARPLGSRLAHGTAQVPVAIVCVLVFATVGQLVGVWLAGHVRAKVVRGRGRPLDAAVGAVLGVVSVLLVAWMIAVPLASSPYPTLAGQASHSRIVRAVDETVPGGLRNVYASLRTFFDRSGFPPVFGDLPATTVVPVTAPPARLSPGVRAQVERVQPSVVKVYSQAPECGRGIEGSGFVFARHRVLTNAHVVAGTRTTQVVLAPGHSLPAKVVVYDPRRDVAVLDVPGLTSKPLRFAAAPAPTGTPAVVLGYPEDGPFTVRSARVRSQTTVGGNDIYGRAGVDRRIYSIRAIVRSGNSGGPLISQHGTVLGMVFATALDSSDTGFALTGGEVRSDVQAGRHASTAVDTQSCTSE